MGKTQMEDIDKVIKKELGQPDFEWRGDEKRDKPKRAWSNQHYPTALRFCRQEEKKKNWRYRENNKIVKSQGKR